MGIKRTPLDAAVSNCVRERADWTCERCGKEFPNRDAAGGSPGLDASHFWGRAKGSTRYTPDNIFAHCRGCHQYLGAHPHEFREWVLKELGETRYDWLTQRANMVIRYSKDDKKAMLKHYKSEFEKMKAKRMNGVTGYMEFSAYD